MEITENKNKSILTIRDNICWICRKEFDKEVLKDRRTYHHSIPQRYNPFKNFKLPICQECHYKMNREDEIYKKYFNKLRGIILLSDTHIKDKVERLKNGKPKKD